MISSFPAITPTYWTKVDRISAQLSIELNLNLDIYQPHRDYWQRFINAGSFLGVTIPKSAGVHITLAAKLRQAEARIITSNTGTPDHHGVTNISGYQEGFHAFHSWGLALDINYLSNPYIMHESGERELDSQLSEVYHRISRFILARDSVIPRGVTLDRRPHEHRWSSRNRDLYNSLSEESGAMRRYFTIMQNIHTLETFISEHNQNYELAFRISSAAPLPTPEEVQRQMLTDWSALTSQSPPTVQGPALSTNNTSGRINYNRARQTTRGDRPFDIRRGRIDSRRSPLNGFLDLRFDVVDALTQQNLLWGATQLGLQSGDVMHFETPHNDPLARVLLCLFRRFP